MSQSINFFLIVLMFLIPEFLFALPSQEAMLALSERHGEIRGSQWKAYREDQEFMDFLSKSPSQYDALSRALRVNDVEAFLEVWNVMSDRVKRFYVSDFDMYSGFTVFHYIASSLNKNADPGSLDDSTLIELMCEFSGEEKYTSLGYTFEGVNTVDYSALRQTALSLAINNKKFNVARSLVACGANPNIINGVGGQTPLMLTAFWGEESFFLKLIELGADHWAVDDQGMGVYYYLNQGRVLGNYRGESQIKGWLNENGHDFNEEALLPCKPFFEESFVRSTESYFVASAESQEDLSEQHSFDWTGDIATRRNYKIEQMQSELIKRCSEEGYANCIPFNRAHFLRPPLVASQSIKLTGEEGILYYGSLRFLVMVYGTKDGRLSVCQSN